MWVFVKGFLDFCLKLNVLFNLWSDCRMFSNFVFWDDKLGCEWFSVDFSEMWWMDVEEKMFILEDFEFVVMFFFECCFLYCNVYI